MSGADDRLARFEAWARDHGSDVRPVERSRIAGELFHAASGAVVRVVDVEALVKRYKDELLGPQRVIAAQRVCQEVLEWQEQEPSTPADPSRPPLASPPVRGHTPAGEAAAPGPRVATWRRKPSSSEVRAVSQDPSPAPPHATPAEAPPESARPDDVEPPAAPAAPPTLDIDMAGIKPRSRGSDAPPPASERPKPLGPGGVAPPPSYPIGARGAFPSITGAGGASEKRPLLIGGAVAGALAIVAALTIVLTRPSCLFADPVRGVSGVFRSKHLGLMVTFPAEWKHAEDLDTSDPPKDGFRKKSAVFFRGASANDYRVRLDLRSFLAESGPADQKVSDDTARAIGAGEAASTALRRACEPLVRGEVRGTRCTSFVAPTGDPYEYLTLEEYFPFGSGVVFTRGSIKVGADHPPEDEAARRTAEEAPSVVAAEKELETLIATIDAIHD